MSEITIKNPTLTIELFGKDGASMGTYSGEQAVAIVAQINAGFKGFITATDDTGKTSSINPDCVCSMTQTLGTEEIKFDDMSTPFGCCGDGCPKSDGNGVVAVQYVDESNTNISPLVTLTGAIGTEYATEQKDLSGYTFASVDGAVSGTYSATPVTVVYHYTKNA